MIEEENIVSLLLLFLEDKVFILLFKEFILFEMVKELKDLIRIVVDEYMKMKREYEVVMKELILLINN